MKAKYWIAGAAALMSESDRDAIEEGALVEWTQDEGFSLSRGAYTEKDMARGKAWAEKTARTLAEN